MIGEAIHRIAEVRVVDTIVAVMAAAVVIRIVEETGAATQTGVEIRIGVVVGITTGLLTTRVVINLLTVTVGTSLTVPSVGKVMAVLPALIHIGHVISTTNLFTFEGMSFAHAFFVEHGFGTSDI